MYQGMCRPDGVPEGDVSNMMSDTLSCRELSVSIISMLGCENTLGIPSHTLHPAVTHTWFTISAEVNNPNAGLCIMCREGSDVRLHFLTS